jgi:hypothetical protein
MPEIEFMLSCVYIIFKNWVPDLFKTQFNLGGETPSQMRAWSLITKNRFLSDKTASCVLKSQRPSPCARRCWSSRFNEVVDKKRIIGKGRPRRRRGIGGR